ncbi:MULTISPECIES: cobalamin-independent methionine synthase II family protein [Anaerococcus]|jgi:methionine synthase II (cobalamin-independent)|uniref:cobalamin-independent methionine synthase II family protein n=1 Tax=Anaerococcus TaxID=165779 RepID=UPI0028FED55C|nr:cobalamin-independent methionine synthase II family protein [Anaerococcus sp.]MDU2599359.1 cobalamin-independent methionine synthase II family protein [Anaerococcus sp.]MDU4025762.1 cobalamin-independent methionine synthase II family protein [Anaerococcus sp.]
MSKRFLTVGSLLREEELLAYKDEIKTREDITYPFYEDLPGYKEAEDKAVANVVTAQKEHNLVQITDGEYSKSLWHLDFVWGLHGVERYIANNGYFFRNKDGSKEKYETRRDIGIKIVDKLNGKNHPFIDHFKRLKKLAGDTEVKQCIPSPSHIYGELTLFIGLDGGYYAGNIEEFGKDLVASYKDFLKEYKQVGGEIIQFDDCLWELFSNDNHDFSFSSKKEKEEQQEELAYKFIDLNNEVIDYGHEIGLKVYTHNCRGNYESRSMSDGSYESIAHLFLEKQNYDRFYLEWDDERAGSIEALQVFKDKDKEIVLGLLSSKTNTLDNEKRVLDLLEKANQIIDKDKLYLSHQCGFASCDEGNELSIDEQWAKIDQGQEIAAKFWGE